MNLACLVLTFLNLSLFVVLLRSMHKVVENQATIYVEMHRMSDAYKDVASALADLQTKVANEATVVSGAVTLIQGIPALIQNAINAASQAGATPAQLQSFADLGDQLTSQASQLASAVASAPNGNVTPGAGVTNPAPAN